MSPTLATHFEAQLKVSPDARLDIITAVVVTFNSAHCMPALAATLRLFRHIVVVDNASEDNVTEALQAVLPQAVLFQQTKNIGFGAANNVAFRAIAAQNNCSQVLLLNPDCRIDLESVLALSETLKASASGDSKIALVAPVIVNAAGKLENKTHVFVANQGSRKMDFLTGACWLGRIEVLSQVGGFDERIFLYYEDTDLCKRLRLAGYDLMLLAGAKAVHASRTSVKMRSDFDSGYLRGFHHTRSKLYFYAKWRGKNYSHFARASLWISTSFLLLPLRLLGLNQHYLGRAWGRWCALTGLGAKK